MPPIYQNRQRRKWYLPTRVLRRARVTIVTTTQARITQAGIELLTTTNPAARITQAGYEAITVQDPNARITQAGVEVIYLPAPLARITQTGFEIIAVIGATFTYFPDPATCVAVAIGVVAQIRGNHQVIAGQASVVMVTIPGPHWSVEVFGALAFAPMSTYNPNPSFDVRPGARAVRTRAIDPWLGAPFNASDNFSNATVIPHQPSDLPYTVRGNTGGFTLEPGEPVPTSGATGSTGWYTFTPTVDGYYQFSLANSLYQTSIAIYEQTGGTISTLHEVGSNQGFRETNVFVHLTAGQQYWVQIGSQGVGGPTGTFQLTVTPQSATCAPSSCEGSVVANFWSGWNGSGSVSIVGGFGGTSEVARALCPQSWQSINVRLTLDYSSNPNAVWSVAWEIHDAQDHLLGGRGSFFGGGGVGISSWQDKRSVTQGGTAVISPAPYSLNLGGDTRFAHWFVIYAFPFEPKWGTLTGRVHGEATYNGTCFVPNPGGGAGSRSWAWWS